MDLKTPPLFLHKKPSSFSEGPPIYKSRRQESDPARVEEHDTKESFQMKKMPMLIAFLTLFVLLANFGSSKVASANVSTIVPLPDTTNGIHLALIHESHASVNAENGVIDYVWGAQLPLPGHTPHKDFYQKFDRAGGDAGLNGSNVSTFPKYYNKDWFLQNHPDWLVYQCNKTALAYEYGDPNVPLDINNPAVR